MNFGSYLLDLPWILTISVSEFFCTDLSTFSPFSPLLRQFPQFPFEQVSPLHRVLRLTTALLLPFLQVIRINNTIRIVLDKTKSLHGFDLTSSNSSHSTSITPLLHRSMKFFESRLLLLCLPRYQLSFISQVPILSRLTQSHKDILSHILYFTLVDHTISLLSTLRGSTMTQNQDLDYVTDRCLLPCGRDPSSRLPLHYGNK